MYFKEVDYTNPKACFDFLHNHFEYNTMNSWNGLSSIANNVKVYNIPGLNSSDALKALEEDEYYSINAAIGDWEIDHLGYEVSFNGRSGGYLVLYAKEHNYHCFRNIANSPCQYDSYEKWEKDVIEDWDSLDNYMDVLIRQVKLVQDFDQLCDDLVALTKQLVDDMHKIEELTRKYDATLRFQRYYYDTIEDLKLHMLDMKRRGYSVWEWSDEDLFVEYEMNEAIHSEVVLDEEGDEDFVYEK